MPWSVHLTISRCADAQMHWPAITRLPITWLDQLRRCSPCGILQFNSGFGPRLLLRLAQAQHLGCLRQACSALNALQVQHSQCTCECYGNVLCLLLWILTRSGRLPLYAYTAFALPVPSSAQSAAVLKLRSAVSCCCIAQHAQKIFQSDPIAKSCSESSIVALLQVSRVPKLADGLMQPLEQTRRCLHERVQHKVYARILQHNGAPRARCTSVADPITMCNRNELAGLATQNQGISQAKISLASYTQRHYRTPHLLPPVSLCQQPPDLHAMAALSAQLLSTRPSLAVSRKSVSGEGRGRQGGARACGRGLATSLPDGWLMRLGRCLAHWCWRLDLITSSMRKVLCFTTTTSDPDCHALQLALAVHGQCAALPSRWLPGWWPLPRLQIPVQSHGA